jgi:transcriptional regulator with XRE-family HTH domain
MRTNCDDRPPSAHADRAQQKAALAAWLKSAMKRKGWSISETARRTSRILKDGERFGAAHVWHYVRGTALPRPHRLEALSSALGMEVDPTLSELLPERGRKEEPLPAKTETGDTGSGSVFTAEACEAPDGTALLKVRAIVPSGKALSVVQLLLRECSRGTQPRSAIR